MSLKCLQGILVLTISSLVVGIQIKSPCPEVLSFKPFPDGPAPAPDRLEATLKVNLEHEVEGIWITLIFGTTINVLTNHFAPATTSDNCIYHLEDPDYILKPNDTLNVSFIAGYNPVDPPPTVSVIHVNGHPVCPSPKKKKVITPTQTEEPVQFFDIE